MSKSLVWELSQVCEALFRDASQAYPTLRMEFEMDLSRLRSLVAHRGLPVFLVDMPNVGKHLDRCLSAGEYRLSGLPLTKRFSNRVVIPKFLRGLYLLVFHETGLLREDYDVEAIVFLRQILFAFKKAKVPCPAENISTEVEEFYAVDSVLPEPEKFWQQIGPTTQDIEETYHGYGKSPRYQERLHSMVARERNQLSVFLAKLDSVSSIVTSTLGSYDPNMWKFRHGPGAVSEVTGPSNKYCWSNWSDRLEHAFPLADYGFHNYASWADRATSSNCVGSREPSARMVAVPKSYSRPRLIAAEPSEHQWCQQNIWHYFAVRSGRSWIGEFVKFNDQTLNQSLCLLGASDETLATVDLSAASDRVTCHAVGQMFRRNASLLLALQASRTRFIDQNLAPRVPDKIELRKFSTMGNACTFPVESLLFLSIAIASVLTARGMRPSLRNIRSLVGEVAVFGDDIVIPVDSRELFVSALEVLDFKVNASKSFWTGKFRESCGVDSFAGVNVTPAYWKQAYNGKPDSLVSVVETANNFHRKFLLETRRYLMSTVPSNILTVGMADGVFGFKSFLGASISGRKTRYNYALQRDEVLARTIRSSQSRTPVEDDSALLQFFTEDPDPTVMWSSGVAQRPRLRMQSGWIPLQDLTLNQVK
jgi:hypothetical protein